MLVRIFMVQVSVYTPPLVSGSNIKSNRKLNSVAPYLFNYGTEEQKMRYLPEMTSGECITCIGMTEPSGGSDLQAMKTFAKKDGDDYILNGSKVVIPTHQPPN